MLKHDPELLEIFERFQGEVSDCAKLISPAEKALIAVVSLVAQPSHALLAYSVERALDAGARPEQIREAVYQCAPYVGFPRVVEALNVIHEAFVKRGVALPLPVCGTVTPETRFDKGVDAQATIFGDSMRQLAADGPEAMTPSQFFLASNCFGDFYTRKGLDLATREMLTLCILVNLGVEPQMRAHIQGNRNMGRSRAFIAEIIYQCLPYAGYPRLLNALRVLDEALPQ